MQLTCFCLGAAPPLVLKTTRAKLAWSAGFTMATAAVALTVGTQVVVAVGRLPPEKVVSQTPECFRADVSDSAFTFRSQTCRPFVGPLGHWLVQRSADM